jgi:hypothetical protein
VSTITFVIRMGTTRRNPRRLPDHFLNTFTKARAPRPVIIRQRRGLFASSLTDAAYDAIASTLGTVAHAIDRDQWFSQVEATVVDCMRAMRRPGESYRDVILRLVELEAGRRWA